MCFGAMTISLRQKAWFVDLDSHKLVALLCMYLISGSTMLCSRSRPQSRSLGGRARGRARGRLPETLSLGVGWRVKGQTGRPNPAQMGALNPGFDVINSGQSNPGGKRWGWGSGLEIGSSCASHKHGNWTINVLGLEFVPFVQPGVFFSACRGSGHQPAGRVQGR